jgi:hypothetical protein
VILTIIKRWIESEHPSSDDALEAAYQVMYVPRVRKPNCKAFLIQGPRDFDEKQIQDWCLMARRLAGLVARPTG